MAHEAQTTQAQSQQRLTPDERRAMLRDFADRMLLKVSAMDDPEDMPGVERAVRTAAAIERIYSRCDRAESDAPDPKQLEAERARNAGEAIHARVHLAGTLEWGEKRRQALGKWWDAADTSAPRPIQTPVQDPADAPAEATEVLPASAPATPTFTVVDCTDSILAARARLGLPPLTEDDLDDVREDDGGVHDPPDW